jgi:hypothetical protein
MRSQRSDGRVVLRIRIGIGCGNDDDPEPAAILATRWQHRCSQCIALPVAQREEKRHLSLYMGLEADVALDRVGPFGASQTYCIFAGPAIAAILGRRSCKANMRARRQLRWAAAERRELRVRRSRYRRTRRRGRRLQYGTRRVRTVLRWVAELADLHHVPQRFIRLAQL